MMEITSEEGLKGLIAKGENERLEFKQAIPHPKQLAILISAFQNTHGGHIILGVSDTGIITGVNKDNATSIYQKAKALIGPYDVSTLNFIQTTKGKQVGALFINPEITRIIGLKIDGIAYERFGVQVRPITASRIISNLNEVIPDAPRDVQAHIADLAMKIEELTKNLVEANSWKSKVPDMIVGAIIGALISFVFSMLVGTIA